MHNEPAASAAAAARLNTPVSDVSKSHIGFDVSVARFPDKVNWHFSLFLSHSDKDNTLMEI